MSSLTAENIIPFRKGGEARTILQGRAPSVLSRLGAPGVGAVIWQRDPLPAFQDWIDGLPPERLPSLRSIVAVGAVERCIEAACCNAGTPPGEMRNMLAGDIAALAVIMSELTRAPLLHLRLEVVTGDACRRFHVDDLVLRMLCTYRGAGTQFAPRGMEHSPHQTASGSVAILRGKAWPGSETTSLLHRSPPIAGAGQTRLLLVIDPALEEAPQGHLH